MKSWVNRIVWIIILALGVHILLRGMEMFAASEYEAIKVRIEEKIGQKVVASWFPGYLYIEKEDTGFLKGLFKQAGRTQGLYAYMEEQKELQIKEEDEQTYEELLLKEAMDENMVNHETNEVIESQAEVAVEDTILSETAWAELSQAMEEENKNAVVAAQAQTEAATNAEEASAQSAVSPPTGATQITGTEYSIDRLNDFDFLVGTFYTVEKGTNITSGELKAETLMSKDMRMSHDNSTPQILIYHTHSQEGFVDSVEGDASTTIVGVGDYLTKILTEQYGYSVIHNTTTFDIVDGKLDRNKAYSMAEEEIGRILQENPSIEVVIDLHRDGIEGVHLVTDINGKQTAKFMFVNGLSYTTRNGNISYLDNPNKQDNLAFSLKMQLTAAKYYPGLTRRILLKAYRYNLHMRPKSLLVEVGSQMNTLQEEKNAMEPLADMLHKVLSGQ